MLAYGKIHRGKIYIYEKGELYIGRVKRNVNRMFKGFDNKPLTFELNQGELAAEFCEARNEIMKTDFI
jgi:hypothetical protein